ncbi:MAG: M28 family metallopeptidase [Firmicutes bacterium]|nr:M28 family metallopeptidase [Bacillota bacterium]
MRVKDQDKRIKYGKRDGKRAAHGVFVFLLAVFAFTVGIPATRAARAADDLSAPEITNTKRYMEHFGEGFADRTAGKDGEAAAAEEIERIFREGHSAADVRMQKTELSAYANAYTRNATARLGPESARKVVIGAHYDNYFSENLAKTNSGTGAEGAYNNLTGLSILLSLYEYFYDHYMDAGDVWQLDFAVEFAAFGAQAIDFAGARYYLGKTDPSDVLMYINLDCVGGGDHLYLYCDEARRPHEDYICGLAQTAGINVKLPPKNKKTMSVSSGITPYTHYGLRSDNVVFMNAGIPSAYLFSRNWDTRKKFGAVESDAYAPIIGTANDTLKTLEELYRGYDNKMDAAARLVTLAVTGEEFVSVCAAARAEGFDYGFVNSKFWANVILLALVALTSAGVYWFYQKLKTRSDGPEPEEFAPKEPHRDSVFGGDYEPKDSSGRRGPPGAGGDCGGNVFPGY